MKTRTRMLLSLAAASVAVAGCQLMQGGGGGVPAGGGPGTMGNCTPGGCQVWVTVNDGPSACTVVDPGSLLVSAKQRVLITWHLSSPRADFTANDGIWFKRGQGTVFSGNHRVQKGVFQVWDDYSTPNNAGHFNYRIKVTTDSGHSCDLDPEVVNG